jgi:hypothetical protein
MGARARRECSRHDSERCCIGNRAGTWGHRRLAARVVTVDAVVRALWKHRRRPGAVRTGRFGTAWGAVARASGQSIKYSSDISGCGSSGRSVIHSVAPAARRRVQCSSTSLLVSTHWGPDR